MTSTLYKTTLVALFVALLCWMTGMETRAGKWTSGQSERGYVVFSHPTTELLARPGIDPWKPEARNFEPSVRAIVKKVSCRLAKGEFESVQIGVYALSQDLRDVQLEVESDLEAQVYTHGYAEYIAAAGGGSAVAGIIGLTQLAPGNTIPSLSAGSTHGWWITFYAKADVPAGKHRGVVRITAAGRPATVIELDLEVRPYALPEPRVQYGTYFHTGWMPDFTRSDGWLRKMYADEAVHGCNSFLSMVEIDHQSTHEDWRVYDYKKTVFLELAGFAKEAGLLHPDIPVVIYAGPEGFAQSREKEKARAAYLWLREQCRRNGWPEVIQYAWDEPPYPSDSVKDCLGFFRDMPVRTQAAMEVSALYGYGDIQDVWVIYGSQITEEMRHEAERMGAEFGAYTCFLHAHHPQQIRYFSGIYTWANMLSNSWIYAYHWLTWYDPKYDRPLPTIAWENWREGIDDYRYLQMLEDGIAAKSDSPRAVEARSWLSALRKQVNIRVHSLNWQGGNSGGWQFTEPLKPDEYDRIRSKAADYVRRLGIAPAQSIKRRSAPGLKDEARTFRGQPIEACVSALSSSDKSIRRAAAWALYEHGKAASPAAEALSGLLGDPETRYPALRALEAIGPDAAGVAPKIATLVSHPDGFVGIGALYALNSVSPTTVRPLVRALANDYAPLATKAGQMLENAPPEAIPALINELPTLIKLLDGLWTERQGPAITMLEKLRTKYASDPQVPADAAACFALVRIRGSREDMAAFISCIKRSDVNGSAAVGYLFQLGQRTREAVPLIRDLLAKGSFDAGLAGRLKQFIDQAAPASR